MVTPFHLLLGNALCLPCWAFPQGYPPSTGMYPADPSFLCPNSAWTLTSVQAVTQLTQLGGSSIPIGDHLQSDSWGAPHSKQKEETLLHKALSRSHQEAFSRDSKLVQKVREDYYWENHLHFDSETSCNMANVFQSMIKSAGLLSSEMHKIKETWTGQSELQYANYALRSLPKGLRFFCPVSPSGTPKVMGLTSIHHPDALHCFNGVTHCPWCGKEGQNEGTVINHLQMTHYKLGLECKKCFHCPSCHIWGHPAPWPKELSAIYRRRPWWIIFVDLTTSARYAKSTLTTKNTWKMWTWMEDQMEDQMSVKLTYWGYTQSISSLSSWSLNPGCIKLSNITPVK